MNPRTTITDTLWNPWAELAAHPEVVVKWDEAADHLGGACYLRVGTRAFILLSPNLPDQDVAGALTHELCHHQRGIVSPPATAGTMDCEERVVRAMTRRRMARYRQGAG